MGTMVILLVIYDGVCVCIFKVYSPVFKGYTQHAFVYDIHISQLDKSKLCVSIISNRSYAPIYVLEGKDRKRKAELKNMLRKLFDDTCIV